ncbi:MAG TPA: excinuclease ABC subunit UvrC [Herpetosiphon sp.]|uniref:UvrABC system protein C n=1 Tax=Herpetosiphon aurantiacus (strain ATCC 23779 / DSM 785 / 114-95) TaxID=316274 RepID=A9B4F8_HERA2|nr:excinuclease ABC subunit UvrC [Herpetosiphon sp.]ABX02715.1 excinuclease ABC, C subunit [Herpetosiphon aurantiacus DSM 785]HBW50682.1 excinuclease ABC subunit UvrC [Herpetosiphon sp.]
MPDLSHTNIANHALFEERLRNLPLSPGVYIYRDQANTIIYVGKSKSLRDRVRSYFGAPRGLTSKTRRLVQNIADFEFITTDTELEALLLEMNLIKKHRPRYNVLLKDDKSYPYIKITKEAWPRVLRVRKVIEDGGIYFGPFAKASSVYATIELLNKLFAFRLCNDDMFKKHERRNRACMYYDIKRCLGPCANNCTTEEYSTAINQVRLFLGGKPEAILRDLKVKMNQAAEDLQFERAAYVRDQIKAVERVMERQKVLNTAASDQDVIAFARDEGKAVVQVFYIRGGKLIGSEPFTLQGTEEEHPEALMSSFLTQFYDAAADIPPNILLPDYPEETQIIEQWLESKGGHKVSLQVPRRGDKKDLVDLAARNASQTLDQLRLQWLNAEQRATAGLSQLRELLNLAELPQRIECYDISNTQGTNSVGSMVVFEQGEPAKKHYRRFKIKTVEGANDVASLSEVLQRRFARADDTGQTDEPESTEQTSAEPTNNDETWAVLPDLILIDGGIGQVNAAAKTLAAAGFEHIPVVGLVKGDTKGHLPYGLVKPGQRVPIAFAQNDPGLHLVQRIDEEAHRFAISYHRKLRTKGMLRSTMEDIPGIGPKRKKALINAFGSLEGIRNASIEELAAVPGMTRKAAEEIKGLL